MTDVTLQARRVHFGSQADEAALFHWLDLLKDFATYRGVGDTIEINVVSSEIHDDQLRELIALFHRYGIDMRQLQVFATRSNKGWLRNKQAYWYEAMHETAPVA